MPVWFCIAVIANDEIVDRALKDFGRELKSIMTMSK